MPLTSVGGGFCIDGNCWARSGFCGPGSSRLVGLFPLILPSAGLSGLPNEAAFAEEAAMPSAVADAAALARNSRLSKSVMVCLQSWFLPVARHEKRAHRELSFAPDGHGTVYPERLCC